MPLSFSDRISQIVEYDIRYTPESYGFVCQAIQTVIQAVRRREQSPRHITAEEILSGIALAADSTFGALGSLVLKEWGIQSNEDVANIVFNMIQRQIFAAGPDDAPEQFTQAPSLFALMAHLNPVSCSTPHLPIIE